MAHERADLRAAIVSALKGPLSNRTSAGVRVYANRFHPLRIADLPVVLVYIESESIDDRPRGPRELKRTAEVKIEGWVMTPPGVAADDALDALALQMETAMDADVHFNGYAYDSRLTSTDIGIKIDGEQAMGAVSLTYDVTYHTQIRVAAPGSTFTTADSRIRVTPTQATPDQPHDVIPIV